MKGHKSRTPRAGAGAGGGGWLQDEKERCGSVAWMGLVGQGAKKVVHAMARWREEGCSRGDAETRRMSFIGEGWAHRF